MTASHPALLAASRSPSADNFQPWRLAISDGSLLVHYCRRNANDPFGPDGHATLLSLGAMAQGVLMADGHPEESVELTPPGAPKGAPVLSVSLRRLATDPLPDIHPVLERHTNRHPFRTDPVPDDLLQRLAGLSRPGARIEVLTRGDRNSDLCELTRICCKARFCSRELHEWLMGSLRFTPAEVSRGDGLDIGTLHLPLGGRVFMQYIRPWNRMAFLNWFGAFRAMAATEVAMLKAAPAIACISGENTRAGVFEAGRLMEDVWVKLNASGWAVHPYYVVADQQSRLLSGRVEPAWKSSVRDAIKSMSRLLQHDDGERLHIMLRIGRPTVNPRRSLRLPLDELCLAAP